MITFPNCTSVVKNTRTTTLLTEMYGNVPKIRRRARKYDPWTSNNPLRESCKQILQPYREKGLFGQKILDMQHMVLLKIFG